MDDSQLKLDEILALLRRIAKTIGVDEFPANLQLLTGDRNIMIPNLPELILFVVRNIDAVSGKWPLEARMLGANGKETTLKLEDQSHAISEVFAALKVVAEDADASVNALVRLAAELISTKVSVLQGNEILRANKKFLGYQSTRRQRSIKLQFSPKIGGLDNKVDNYEMKQFFTPSTQQYLGYECVDKRDLMGIALRTLEDGEIARAAMFKPLIKDKKGKSSLTGDHIRETREAEKKKQDEEWKDFQGMLKKQGAKYRVSKGVKKREKNGFDNGSRDA
ncbi:MAG: hypothetical protein HC857_11890 [Synechococcales cyanobacterium RU_4_20]|nr:hypothetical protein [Synechococcales cyanobacterium RU_4_20]NJR70525.1 hypothetical protein [Synechococcales cyanobacterium CRU_2_2]